MKKNIGNVLALYPTPAVVVGTEVNGKVNWLRKVSVNMVNEAMLERADYVGCASGAKADKSDVFVYHIGEAGTPVIDENPLVMECEVVDNYETETFDNFICKITNTYVDEDCLNEKGKPDYDKLKPVLFEMPNYTYLRTGETIGKCTSFGKAYNKKEEER